MRGTARQAAVVLAALFNVILNALAGAGLLFGVQTGAVSDAVPTGVTPAGWAFAIWTLIFVGVLVFAAWQAAPARRDARYDALGLPFVVANVLNGLWQVPWLLSWFGVSVVLIFGIVAALAWLYIRLDQMTLRGRERWMLGVPAALFLAWLMVAAPLNVTVWLASLGWSGGGIPWPPLLVLVVAALGGWLLSRTADVAALLVFLWAFAGIASAHMDQPVLLAALGLGAVALVAAVVVALRRGRSPFPTAHSA
jgi:hypothetical protein